MTKIKLCGLTRPCDVAAANELAPEYAGFVFAPKSRRYVPPEKATMLKRQLSPGILAVGVFVNEAPETIGDLMRRGIIDIAQLHGNEDEEYIKRLRALLNADGIRADVRIIQAFRVGGKQDLLAAKHSTADFILLDSGEGGSGQAFDWSLPRQKDGLGRPFFLAGGLTPNNVTYAVSRLNPYAVDVSSGIETDGLKDFKKMKAFVHAVRKAEQADALASDKVYPPGIPH